MNVTLYILLNPWALGLYLGLIVFLVPGGQTHRPVKLRRVLLWVALGFLILNVVYMVLVAVVNFMEGKLEFAALPLLAWNAAGGWWWRRAFRRGQQPGTAPPPPRVRRKPILGIASLGAIPACTVAGCLFLMYLGITGHADGESPTGALGGVMVLMVFAGIGSVLGLLLAIVAAVRREGWWGFYAAGFALNAPIVLVALFGG